MQEIALIPILGFVLVGFLFYWIMPASKKSYALLVASLVGLGLASVLSLLCFLIFTIITYWVGIAARKYSWAITLGVIVLLCSLGLYAFKFTANWHLWSKPIYDIFSGQMLIGWSYFLFNAISYLLDIERKVIQAEPSFVVLMRYLLFFPMLFSGPMHRKKQLEEQFEQVAISTDSIQEGLRLMLWGLFKNVIIAKRLLLLFQFLQNTTTGPAVLTQGIVFFFYIYASFSSFVDFFQGVALLFNIKMSDNFHKRVYWASSRHQFWQGWHMTLNAWFKDYFFYRLMKYKYWRNKTQLALFLTFLLIALWHGATKIYLVWGILNASWILLEKRYMISEFFYKTTFTKVLGRIYHIGLDSFIALVFVQDSLRDLFHKLIQPWHFPEGFFWIERFNLPIIILSFIGMDYLYRCSKEQRIETYLKERPFFVRQAIYIVLVFGLIVFGHYSEGIDNYYFRF